MSVHESVVVEGATRKSVMEALLAGGAKVIAHESGYQTVMQDTFGAQYYVSGPASEQVSFLSANYGFIPLSVFRALARPGSTAKYIVYTVENDLIWEGDQLALRQELEEQKAVDG